MSETYFYLEKSVIPTQDITKAPTVVVPVGYDKVYIKLTVPAGLPAFTNIKWEMEDPSQLAVGNQVSTVIFCTDGTYPQYLLGVLTNTEKINGSNKIEGGLAGEWGPTNCWW